MEWYLMFNEEVNWLIIDITSSLYSLCSDIVICFVYLIFLVINMFLAKFSTI